MFDPSFITCLQLYAERISCHSDGADRTIPFCENIFQKATGMHSTFIPEMPLIYKLSFKTSCLCKISSKQMGTMQFLVPEHLSSENIGGACDVRVAAITSNSDVSLGFLCIYHSIHILWNVDAGMWKTV